MAATTTNFARRNMRHMPKHPPIESSEVAHNPPEGKVAILPYASLTEGISFKCDPVYGRRRNSPFAHPSLLARRNGGVVNG